MLSEMSWNIRQWFNLRGQTFQNRSESDVDVSVRISSHSFTKVFLSTVVLLNATKCSARGHFG